MSISRKSITRIVTLTILSAIVAGCQIQRDYAQRLETIQDITRTMFSFDSEKLLVSRESVLKIPVATLGVQQHKNFNESAFRLMQVTPVGHIWLGPNKSSIMTAYGRILRTAGLQNNLTDQVFQNRDPLANPVAVDWDTAEATRSVDYNSEIGFGYKVNCTYEEIDTGPIKIIEASHEVRLIVEKCESDAIRWRFKNKFWIDAATGFIWKSEQWTHPLQKSPIRLQTLRPSAEDPAWRNHLITNAIAKAKK
jgi:hypothetical protein